jgi:hypothetical protein
VLRPTLKRKRVAYCVEEVSSLSIEPSCFKATFRVCVRLEVRGKRKRFEPHCRLTAEQEQQQIDHCCRYRTRKSSEKVRRDGVVILHCTTVHSHRPFLQIPLKSVCYVIR